ncbi:glycosyltransferase family 4 protein [Fusobacterium sp. THCT1E2]
MKKNIVMFSTENKFEKYRLYKDSGLITYYLGKEYNHNSIFFCCNVTKILPSNFRSMKIIEERLTLKSCEMFPIYRGFEIKRYTFLIKNIKNIDFLLIFQFSRHKILFIFLYKLLNKKGKIYIKLDATLEYIKRSNKNDKKLIDKFSNYFIKKALNKVELFSCETKECFDEIEKNGLYNFDISDKLAHIQNGFDEDYLIENNIKIKKFEEKENIMITVGRIGSEEKNNEMLLNVIEKMNLKNWKIYIIGSYTKKFKKYYDDFIKNDPDKKDKVILVGNIEDKNLLYDYYNRAKVFLLTSRWEGFALVYPEALKFGNYIITTDVGGAKDITDNGQIGVIVKIEDEKQYKKEILKVINGEINFKEKYLKSLEWSNRNFLWSNIVKHEKFKEFFNGEN